MARPMMLLLITTLLFWCDLVHATDGQVENVVETVGNTITKNEPSDSKAVDNDTDDGSDTEDDDGSGSDGEIGSSDDAEDDGETESDGETGSSDDAEGDDETEGDNETGGVDKGGDDDGGGGEGGNVDNDPGGGSDTDSGDGIDGSTSTDNSGDEDNDTNEAAAAARNVALLKQDMIDAAKAKRMRWLAFIIAICLGALECLFVFYKYKRRTKVKNNI